MRRFIQINSWPCQRLLPHQVRICLICDLYMWVCHFVFSTIRSITSSRDFLWYLLYQVNNCGNYFFFSLSFFFFFNCNDQVMSKIALQCHQSPIPFNQGVSLYGRGIKFIVLTIAGFFLSSFLKLILQLESNTLYRESKHEIAGSGSYLLFSILYFFLSQFRLYFPFFN